MRLAILALFAITGGLASPARLEAQPKKLPPDLEAPTDPLSPADERKAFTVPAGFDVQLIAAEPDIQKPMQMAFDAKGRMWVTTSYHYPFAAPAGKGTDKVFVLSDFDPATGKARKVQTFCSDLNIPIGILPLPDCKSIIVSSVGEIRKYTDADGDGKADGPPEVLFTGFGSRDTHGMYNSFTLMPDGWVYACHGFNNDSTVKGKDGHEVKMHSGNTFRFRPDGSRIEVYTRGQVNPFGMTIDPWFNLYTADCHSKPITQLIPGAYYDSFGKPHDGLGYGPHVTRHDHGSTGLCGLAWYDADHFPKDYLGCMFVGNVVTNRINFDKIEWKGASPVAKELPDFLVSTDRWFRPVDIKLGPDGALYVADFYNKIIGHYEVDLKHPGRDKDRGRIWRIVWKGKGEPGVSAPGFPPPKFAYTDLTTAKGEVIDELLGHPNIAVRLMATNQALHRGEVMQARKGPNDVYTVHRMWVDEMLSWRDGNGDLKREAYREDQTLLAAHQYRIQRAVTELLRESKKPMQISREKLDVARADPHLARAVVEMMAGSPKADYVNPLLAVLNTCAADDTHLKLATRIALRNCLRDSDTWPKEFDPTFAEMALAIPSQKAVAYLVSQLQNLPADQLPAFAEHIGRHSTPAERSAVFALATKLTAADAKPQDMARGLGLLRDLLRGVQAGGKGLVLFSVGGAEGKEIVVFEDLCFRDWSGPAKDPAVARNFAELFAGLPAACTEPERGIGLGLARTALVKLVRNPAASDQARGIAVEALGRFNAPGTEDAMIALHDDPKTSPALREKALVALCGLTGAKPQAKVREGLKAAPYRVAVAVSQNMAGTRFGAENLLLAVKEGQAPARLLQEKAILERLRAVNIPDLDKQIGELTKGLPPLDARLAELIKKRSAAFASAKPDKELGAKLFTKHCGACHRIGDNGGKIAPQLDGIGLRGLERLLEDTLDPNRNVDQAFRARIITTKDEKTVTGLVLRVEGEVLVIADGEGKEVRIAMKDIETNRETMLSPMPANVADILSEAEFMHLMAYLLDQKKDTKKE